MTSVLIVDDNPDDREWLTDLAKQAGAKTTKAFSDCQEAHKFLWGTKVDLILLDDRLDDFRGLAIGPAMRVRCPDACIAVISGAGFKGIDDVSSSFGAFYFDKADLSVDVVRSLFKGGVKGRS